LRLTRAITTLGPLVVPLGCRLVIRVFVLYSEAPEPARYEQHVELNRRELPEATIRHGPILGTPQGQADVAYYFEYEFPDRDSWKQAQAGLLRAAEDAQGLGVPFRVYFAELG
jgi:hypothetical protein